MERQTNENQAKIIKKLKQNNKITIKQQKKQSCKKGQTNILSQTNQIKMHNKNNPVADICLISACCLQDAWVKVCVRPASKQTNKQTNQIKKQQENNLISC